MSKKKSSKKWTKKHDKILLEMFYDDKSYGEIATKLKRTYHAVAQRIHKLRNEGVQMNRRAKGRPLKSKKQVKPSSVKVAEKVLKAQKKPKKEKKMMRPDHGNSDSTPLKLSAVISDGKKSLTAITRLFLYAEMLEKQNAALKQRLADVEKALRD